MRQSRSSAENSSDISGASFSETDSFSNRSGISRNTSSRISPRSMYNHIYAFNFPDFFFHFLEYITTPFGEWICYLY